MSTRAAKVEMLKCRALRSHAWEFFTPGPGDPKPAPYGRGFSLVCTRCTTQRHDTFDARGELNARKYVYPQGYQYATDERPTTEQLRLSLIREMRQEHAVRIEKRTQRKHRAPVRQPQRRKHPVSV